MLRLLRLVPVIAVLLAAGCQQGEGERCQLNSDCASGLICSSTGICVKSGQDIVDVDASPPPDARVFDAAPIDAVPPPDAPPGTPDAATPDAAPTVDAAASDATST